MVIVCSWNSIWTWKVLFSLIEGLQTKLNFIFCFGWYDLRHFPDTGLPYKQSSEKRGVFRSFTNFGHMIALGLENISCAEKIKYNIDILFEWLQLRISRHNFRARLNVSDPEHSQLTVAHAQFKLALNRMFSELRRCTSRCNQSKDCSGCGLLKSGPSCWVLAICGQTRYLWSKILSTSAHPSLQRHVLIFENWSISN